ncbi:MAG: restriction endonuclease subunit S [Bacteroidia bacterium]|nr:restriction endonuclease subunit S [Bacteroidia bacterium]
MRKISKNKLPDSWVVSKVGEVFKTSSGGTPNTSRKDFWQNGTIPWINSGALKDDIINEPTTLITELGLANSSAKVFPINTVVIALTGSTTGKVGLLNIASSTNQSVVGIYPSKYLNYKFLFYYFISIRSKIFAQAIGSAQPHINKGIIDDTIIPIPPIEHQKIVVDILNEVSEKIENIIKRSKEIEALEDEAFKNYIYNDDELFPEVKLGSYCISRSERIGNAWKGKRLIGVSKDTGIIDLRIAGRESFEKYKIVMPGDFIYNPMRVDIGSIAIYEGKDIALTSPDYVVFSIEHTLSPLLLLKFLKSNSGLSQINNNTQGSVRSRLYFKNLSEMNFPFSGQSSQEKAQTVLEGFKKMKEESLKIQNELKNISEETFGRAFNGELLKNEPFKESGKMVVEKMKIEKKNYTNGEHTLEKKEKINKMKKTKSKVNILDFITKVFGNEKFTFDKLYNKSGIEYETLKADLYLLIDKNIVLEFDINKETMYLKLK